jgi:pimeloyl-ACP methyl ester carboxylesterase
LSTTACSAADLPPAPGKIVDISGTKLHINCLGTGSPVVILESGLPGVSLDWVLVQPEVAKVTRVCSYDRAGFGWSGPGKQPRTADQIADELAALLLTAAVPPPYVLVGHSAGGIYVRRFTRKHPDQVIGMVLVDSTHEGALAYDFQSYWTPPGTAPPKRQLTNRQQGFRRRSMRSSDSSPAQIRGEPLNNRKGPYWRRL